MDCGKCVTSCCAPIRISRRFKYWSFKAFNLKKSVPFVAVLFFVILVALLSWQPPIVLFGAFVVYAVSGYATAAWTALRKRRVSTPH